MTEKSSPFGISRLFGVLKLRFGILNPHFAFVLLALGALAFVFFSPFKIIGGVLGAGALIATLIRPASALPYLMVLVALEPFALKWIPDDLYIYARYFSEILIYALGAGVIKQLFLKKIPFRFPPAFACVMALAVIALISAGINETPTHVALLGTRQILRFLVLFCAVALLNLDTARVKILVITLFALLAFESGLGLAQALIGAPLDEFLLPAGRKVFADIQLTAGTDQFWESGQRVFATMGRYDQLGTFLCFALLLAVGMLYEFRPNKSQITNNKSQINPNDRTSKLETVSNLKFGNYLGFGAWRLGFVFLLGIPALLLTYSRASWFGFLLGFFCIAVLVKKNKKILAAFLISLAIFSGYLLYSWGVVSHLTDAPRQTVIERLSESLSFERWRGEYIGLGRLYYIIYTPLKVVSSSPLFGVGPGSYGGGVAAALHYTAAYEKADVPFGIYGTEGYIDNNWFSLWGELGTLGLGAYILLFVLLARSSYRIYRSSSDPLMRGLSLGFLGVIPAVSLQAFLGTYLEVRTLALYFWLFAGVIVSYDQYENNSRS